MFEQSMLLDHAAGKKTGALAASITLQTMGVGLLILIPLFFGEHLGVVQPFISLSVPVSQPPEPKPVQSAPVETVRSSILSARVFHPQMSAAPSAAPVMIDSIAPSIGVVGVPPGVASTGVLAAIGEVAVPVHEPAPAAAVVKLPEKPVPVGGDVQAAKLIRKVVPQYPPLARAARISGTVRLIGIIAKDGTIQQLQVVSGNPLLIQAAVNAVRQWIYRPTLLNGEAVEVTAPIDVIFSLSK